MSSSGERSAMRGRALAVGLAALMSGVLGVSAAALGQGSRSSSLLEVVKTRQQAFKRLGAAMKVIHYEVRGAAPNVAKIEAAAAEVESAASHLGEWFPAGTGPDAGLKTHAKADIWSDGRGFAAARTAFVRQAEKSAHQLSDPAQRGAWKDAAAALGQTCRDCHDSYRLKSEE